ncbi:Znf1 [Zalerion maritima]|uniref:Znf1 n=1 Tax=Zalerion maritima TaxID=339359 RepID=A0AAD5WR21_9PEZI|nr:Znf1 [Zalerion maritima]
MGRVKNTTAAGTNSGRGSTKRCRRLPKLTMRKMHRKERKPAALTSAAAKVKKKASAWPPIATDELFSNEIRAVHMEVFPKRDRLVFMPDDKPLRPRRDNPPPGFHALLNKAFEKRFFILNRWSAGTAFAPQELVEIMDDDGHVYQTLIKNTPTCNCPKGFRKYQCEHWVFIMAQVLCARWGHLYQIALLNSELRDIFWRAPGPVPYNTVAYRESQKKKKERKPTDGFCIVCYIEFKETNPGDMTGHNETDADADMAEAEEAEEAEEAACPADGKQRDKDDDVTDAEAKAKHQSDDSSTKKTAGEELVWCRGVCGQNIHQRCFEQWNNAKSPQSHKCPYCRSPWNTDPADAFETVKKEQEWLSNMKDETDCQLQDEVSDRTSVKTWHLLTTRGYFLRHSSTTARVERARERYQCGEWFDPSHSEPTDEFDGRNTDYWGRWDDVDDSRREAFENEQAAREHFDDFGTIEPINDQM